MHSLQRRAARAAAAIVVASGLGACASGPHTPDHVSTIVAHEAAAKASRLHNVGVVVIPDSFNSGSRPNSMALAATGNDHMNTLFQALSARLPAQFAGDGVHAEAVAWMPGRKAENARALAPYDYVVEVTAMSISLQKNTAGPSMLLKVRVLNHALQPLWEAHVELRTDDLPDGQRNDIRQWGKAMADDLCGLLLQQLGEDGFVAAAAR